ncbi:hypothetical protein EDC04DRAFT_1975576 [Pisolithus marmoratus]|nr:hypothetical protein EDC04DRAFT_1975576 [Pisolithus marmoratus]
MIMPSVAAARAFRNVVVCHRQPSSMRAFHSPFVALKATSQSPLTSSPAPSATISPISASLSSYEKEVDDNASEPHVSSAGTRTYVVSEPDPSNTAYEVPMVPTPPLPPTSITHSQMHPRIQRVNTAPRATQPHPYNKCPCRPQNEYGIGESAAVRNAEAPGEMGRRGGSYGGLGLMDEKTSTPGGPVASSLGIKITNSRFVREG